MKTITQEEINEKLINKSENGSVSFDLTNYDLTEIYFPEGTIFEKCDFGSSDFSRLSLSKIVFKYCHFIDAIFKDTNFHRVDFFTCFLLNINVNSSIFTDCLFHNSEMTVRYLASFYGTSFYDTIFYDAFMPKLLSNCNFYHTVRAPSCYLSKYNSNRKEEDFNFERPRDIYADKDKPENKS